MNRAMNFVRVVLAVAILASAALAGAGQAAAETRTVQGQMLALTLTQSDDTVISTDPALADTVRITANGSLDCLAVHEGRTAVVGTAACAGDDLGTLHIAVAPHMPVELAASGGGSIQISDLHASLTVDLGEGTDLKAGDIGSFALSVRGGGDVAIGTVDGSASLRISGSGDVMVGTLNGPLSLKRTGSGDLSIGTINAPAVAIDSTGSGDTRIGRGSIGGLQANLRGSGDLAVSATVSSGQVAASGGGDIKLATVTGPLSRSASGGSNITVGVEGAGDGAVRGVAQAGDPGRHETVIVAKRDHTAHDVTMAAVAAVLLYLAWRILRRLGSGTGWRGPAQPAAPMHPGVLAVGETMMRLEQRLGRIEGYVTTREFDLNRKFRDLK